MSNYVNSEIECHECDTTFLVKFDISKNGNHVVNCPKCGHEHCRVIKGGRVTSTRWDSRNGPTWHCTAASTSMFSSISGISFGTTASDSYVGGWTERRSI